MRAVRHERQDTVRTDGRTDGWPSFIKQEVDDGEMHKTGRCDDVGGVRSVSEGQMR